MAISLKSYPGQLITIPPPFDLTVSATRITNITIIAQNKENKSLKYCCICIVCCFFLREISYQLADCMGTLKLQAFNPDQVND